MSSDDMRDIVTRRRFQADHAEQTDPPKVGDWNIPQMLREDADEIERLRLIIKGLTHMLDKLKVIGEECVRDRWFQEETGQRILAVLDGSDITLHVS